MDDIENTEAPLPLDKLVRIYRKMRDHIQKMERDHEAELLPIKEQHEAVKQAIKDQMLTLGTTSVRTPNGTVTLTTMRRYSTNDWGSFKTFMVENEAIDLLEHRISQTNMRRWLEENPGLVPPGLNSNAEYSVSVRKPS
jgi:hypothetical protein